VDGVMNERKLMREVLDACGETEKMIEHCSMLQKARDNFDRECERLRSGLQEIISHPEHTPQTIVERLQMLLANSQIGHEAQRS